MEKENLLKAMNYSKTALLNELIGNTYIVDFGFITEILAEGIVIVQTSVASMDIDQRLITCTLANAVSDNFSVNIKPSVGDKVLVLFTRRFHVDMFDRDKEETIVEEGTEGYNVCSGIAILCNQFRKSDYEKNLSIEEDAMKLTYGSVESEVDTEGNIDIKNESAGASIDSEGNIEIKNDNASIEIASSGAVTLTNGNTKVEIDAEGNIMLDANTGLVAVKNSSASLQAILTSILTILNSTFSVNPDTGMVTSPQFADQLQQVSQLLLP